MKKINNLIQSIEIELFLINTYWDLFEVIIALLKPPVFLFWWSLLGHFPKQLFVLMNKCSYVWSIWHIELMTTVDI